MTRPRQLALLDDPRSIELDPHHVAVGKRGVEATREALSKAREQGAEPCPPPE